MDAPKKDESLWRDMAAGGNGPIPRNGVGQQRGFGKDGRAREDGKWARGDGVKKTGSRKEMPPK